MPESGLFSVEVDLQLSHGDDEDLDQLTRQLHQELFDLGVESVEFIRQGKAPPGAKVGLDPVVLGALLVAVGPMVLTKFLEFLQTWVLRREGCTIKLNILSADGALVQVEVPQTMSQVEMKRWLDSVEKVLANTNKNSVSKNIHQEKS